MSRSSDSSEGGSSSLLTDSSDEPPPLLSHSPRSTAPTEYSLRPAHSRGETWPPVNRARNVSFAEDEDAVEDDFSSTIPSEDDLVHDVDRFQTPKDEPELYPSSAIPSTPEEFADMYPSTRRLNITHDDASSDGNMCLRVDCHDRGDKMTLFYLKMEDLRTRDFSLRRYGRSSGREVCSSLRQTRQQQNSSRPNISRSLSGIFGRNSSSKSEVRNSFASALKRHDSGYASMHGQDRDEDDCEDEGEPEEVQKRDPKPAIADLTDTINMEFSNYFHLSVKRAGLGPKKHYNFDYWGKSYSWKRVARKYFDVDEASYHLVRQHDKRTLAHIMPLRLTPDEAMEEQSAGGWVPPCSFWLTEGMDSISADLGDIFMSTGLMSLVDDTIRKRFHSREARQVLVPALNKLDPRRIIDEAFHRHSHHHHPDQQPRSHPVH